MEPELRKTEIEIIKNREQRRAELVHHLSVERTRRRAREFSIRALQAYRHGILQETNYAKQVEQEKLLKQMEMEKERQKQLLVTSALKSDKKWRHEDKASVMKHNDLLLDYADTSHLPEYSDKNPVSAEREHPYSWRLKLFNNAGLPLETTAAGEVRCCTINHMNNSIIIMYLVQLFL